VIKGETNLSPYTKRQYCPKPTYRIITVSNT
jgi:hypothetical protein